MNKHLKKILIYFFISLLVFSSITLTYLYIPKTLDSFDNRLRDFMFVTRGPIDHTDNIVVIDIDNQSLQEVGQWPWGRDIISKLLMNLTNGGIGIIGFDMVFAEEDRTSITKILEKYKIETDKEVPDYDQIFANTITQTPTILGYQFELEKDTYTQTTVPELPNLTIIERNKHLQIHDLILEAQGTILNHPLIQNSGYSSGFFNNVPDESGVVRSVPLIIRYDDQLFPSLALEILRVASNVNKIYVDYDINGVASITVGDFMIPTDRYGRLVVNFRGASKTFTYLSAVDILNNNFDPKLIEGKIALIGTSAAGLLDLRSIPLESVYPGVEVHANVIDNILSSDFIFKPSWIDGLNIFHFLILSFLIVFLIAYTSPLISFLMLGVLLPLDLYLIYTLLFDEGLILNILFPILTFVVATIVAFTVNYFLETRKTSIIKTKFASKVSKEVMDSLLENPDDESFAAMEKEITIFFSDVRNFTNISEAIGDPKLLIEFLNEYMDPMTDIIIEQKGTVDKFIGDAIMAYWNAPGSVEDHAQRALVATMEQLHQLDRLNKQIKEDPRFDNVVKMAENSGVQPLDIGIGLNTGFSVVGEMGSSQRSDYTAIGDPINLGSRLESLCKFYGSKCNISSYTKEQVIEDDFIFRFLDLVTVKGKKEPVEIWQVVDYFDENKKDNKLYKVSREELFEEIAQHHKAIALYKDEQFKEALHIFQSLESNNQKTNDKIYKIYIDRCEHYIETPPENFNGVFTHTTKG